MTILAIILGCIVVIQFGFIVSLYRTMVYYREKVDDVDGFFDGIDEYFDNV